MEVKISAEYLHELKATIEGQQKTIEHYVKKMDEYQNQISTLAGSGIVERAMKLAEALANGYVHTLLHGLGVYPPCNEGKGGQYVNVVFRPDTKYNWQDTVQMANAVLLRQEVDVQYNINIDQNGVRCFFNLGLRPQVDDLKRTQLESIVQAARRYTEKDI